MFPVDELIVSAVYVATALPPHEFVRRKCYKE